MLRARRPPAPSQATGSTAVAFAGGLLLCVLLLGGLLASCSSAVQVTPPDGAPPVCREAGDRWPGTVGDLPRRDTTSDSPAVAAWGDPAVIARCGVSALGPTTEECIAVSGVDWVARDLSDGMRFTTYGRDPAIEVLVPDEYAPGTLLLPAFGEAAKALPENGRRCQ